jgi:hypothetical protein
MSKIFNLLRVYRVSIFIEFECNMHHREGAPGEEIFLVFYIVPETSAIPPGAGQTTCRSRLFMMQKKIKKRAIHPMVRQDESPRYRPISSRHHV